MKENLLEKIKEGREPKEQEFIERAFRFAELAHLGQKRVSGEDYITHPLEVAAILNGMKLDAKTIAAAFLHDVADDTAKTLEDIEKEFGKEVSFLVEGVSKLGKLRYSKSGLEIKPIETRISEPIDLQAENLRKMFFAMAEDIRVILIKLTDRLHNMETLDFLPQERQKRIALETLEIFAPLANRLGMGGIKGRLEDLAFPYLYPKEFEWLQRHVKEKYEEREKYIGKVRPFLLKILEKEGMKPLDIHSRAKHYWSLYQKLLKYEMNVEKIYDLVALRIIVDSIETCYKTLGIVHKYFKPLPGRIKDYIAFPKPNNYRAIHTTCFCLDGKITEIQVKTREMHEEDEFGIASHWAHKEGIDLKAQKKKFAWVAQLSNWQKRIQDSKEFLESLKIDFFKNRIFAFTPKGDVIDLPEGATTVDFAYSVHTDIGNKCLAAKINGKIFPLSQSLKNGDLVEIIIDKKKKPSRDWLEFVKTSIARSKIRESLKKEAPPENLSKKILSPLPKMRPQIQLEKRSKGRSPVALGGEEGMQVYLAKCCGPKPGEEIKAYITRNRGASVHKFNCRNIAKAETECPQKIIGADWIKEKNLSHPVWLLIKAEDRLGLLRDISSAISELGINILTSKTETGSNDHIATISTKVEISDQQGLDRLFSQLKQTKGVLEVRKA